MNLMNYVHDLFKEYLKKRRDGEDASLLRAEIDEIVLTGEHILESGIISLSEDSAEELEGRINELEDKLERYKKSYKNGLKNLYEKYLYQKGKKGYVESYEKISKIEKIIQGKKGIFIDEIKEAIK